MTIPRVVPRTWVVRRAVNRSGRTTAPRRDLTVFFKPADRPGITPDQNHVATNFASPGDFSVGQPGNIPPAPLAEIIFTLAPGYEVSLVRFARRRGTSTNNNANFSLRDPNGLSVYMLNVPSNPLEKVTEAVNSAFYAGPITFGYNSTQGFTRVDDILLELRAVPVPEPSSCVMLLGLTSLGFGRTRKYC